MTFLLYSNKDNSNKKEFYWLTEEVLTSLGHQVVVDKNTNYDAIIIYGKDDVDLINLNKRNYPILIIPCETSKHGLLKVVETNFGKVLVSKSINVEKITIKKENITYLSFDLIHFLFYYLAEDEYHQNEARDKYNRLTFKLSQKSISEIEKPIVNMWGKWIDNWLINSLSIIDKPYLRKCHWPNQADIAISFSHDVDIVNKNFYAYWRTFAHYVYNNETSLVNFINSLFKELFSRLIKFKSVFNNYQFDTINLFHKKNNIQATFNIITSKAGILDLKTYIDIAKNDIKRLLNDGHDIGLHGGFQSKSYFDDSVFIQEKELLEKNIGNKVVSTRQHYLGFEFDKTFLILEKAGILVDSTVGYPDSAGFKSGFNHPYQPWLFKEDRKCNVYQLPLILMDGTLMSKTYSNLSLLDAKDKFLYFFTTVKKYNGVLTINWHQRIFSEGPYYNWMQLYYFMVNFINKNNSYKATKKDIIKRYNAIKLLQLSINQFFVHIQSPVDIISFSFILHWPYRLKKIKSNNTFIEVIKEGYCIIEIPKIEADKIIMLPLHKIDNNDTEE